MPKPDGPHALNVIDAHLMTRETQAGLPHGAIKLLPVATETPVAALSLQDYRSPPPRLAAMTWGAEDLSAALGAAANRDEHGEFLFAYRVVRSLCLIAAKAADVPAIETLHADFRDATGLERAARAAQREGFAGMLAIHPGQVETINKAFTPSESDVAHARKVVAAFAGGAGVASLDGKMLDQPISSRRSTCWRWMRRSADEIHPPLEGGSKNAQHFSGRGLSQAVEIGPSPKFSSHFVRKKIIDPPSRGELFNRRMRAARFMIQA